MKTKILDPFPQMLFKAGYSFTVTTKPRIDVLCFAPQLSFTVESSLHHFGLRVLCFSNISKTAQSES